MLMSLIGDQGTGLGRGADQPVIQMPAVIACVYFVCCGYCEKEVRR